MDQDPAIWKNYKEKGFIVVAILIISLALFISMSLFPILCGLLPLRNGRGILEIDQGKIKDPRYFAKSFNRLFDQSLAKYDGSGEIYLSREEKIFEADKVTQLPIVCKSIVYAENLDFRPRGVIRFEKDIYAKQNAIIENVDSVRAVSCRKDLYLGRGTKVIRWVDAEGVLEAAGGCNLGISASSNTQIILGSNCLFRRLYAPAILFGCTPGEKSFPDEEGRNIDVEEISSLVIPNRNINYVNDDLADRSGVVNRSIITRDDITVLDNLTVKGHIRSHQSIRLCDGAVVYGNLFAEGDIYLGRNCRVYGSVFTQGSLFVESGVSIGQPGKIKSVVSRGKMIIEKKCRVYGYVSSETGGICCPDSVTVKEDAVTVLPKLKRKQMPLVLPQKLRPAAVAAALLVLVFGASFSATAVFNVIRENEKLLEESQSDSETSFGVDGKKEGELLAAEPELVTEEYVYFEDRVLERFHYNANDIADSINVLSGMFNALPDSVNKHLMIAPMRICFEERGHEYGSGDVNRAIAEIYNAMPPDVKTLDVFSALYAHKGEYLFFRTDHKWTALAAYYAAAEFCKSTGIKIKDIKEYQENRYNYSGTLRALPDAQSLANHPDFISYYILHGATNKQTITDSKGSNQYLTYEAPAVALSRRGYDIFVGRYFSHSILHGDATNGRTLMIVGDDYSKPLATWLTPYYENVVLINSTFFYGGAQEFRQFFSEYQVSDFLFMEYAKNIGNGHINRKLRNIQR